MPADPQHWFGDAFAHTRANERVEITTGRESVKVTWEERQELLDRIWQAANGAVLGGKFEAVGTSRPVVLEGEDVDLLDTIVGVWDQDAGDLPEGIRRLREMLQAELVCRRLGPG
jgi:hypothetical protein